MTTKRLPKARREDIAVIDLLEATRRERDELRAALTAALEQNERFAAEIARLRAVVDEIAAEDDE